MKCEHGGRYPGPRGAVVRLSEHRRRGLVVCPERDDQLDGVALVSLDEVLDSKRLSAMATHPSAQPRQHSVIREELD
jgi:hypothetical protein